MRPTMSRSGSSVNACADVALKHSVLSRLDLRAIGAYNRSASKPLVFLLSLVVFFVIFKLIPPGGPTGPSS